MKNWKSIYRRKTFYLDQIEDEEAPLYIAAIEEHFPIGSVLVTEFYQNSSCIFQIKNYFYDATRETIAAHGYGINSIQKIEINGRYGLNGNRVRLATKEESETLLKEINKNTQMLWEKNLQYREDYAERMMILHCHEHGLDTPNHIIKDAFRIGFDDGFLHGYTEGINSVATDTVTKPIIEKRRTFKARIKEKNNDSILTPSYSTFDPAVDVKYMEELWGVHNNDIEWFEITVEED